MKSTQNQEKAIDEIVKIIKDFQYNDELSDKYRREIFDGKSIITVRCPGLLSFSIVAKSLTKNFPFTEGNQSFNAFR